MSERRKGKIARLPFDIRQALNSRVRDGQPYSRILAWLKEQGHAGIAEINLSHWVQGDGSSSGYRDWLREQERLEDMGAKREFAMEIVRANEGSKLHEATMHLAASQLYEALTEFDLAALKNLLAEKPENYAAIVNSLAKLSKQALDIEKFKEHVRQRKEAIERELGVAKNKGGLTAETIEKIERELKLL